jgi:hypothetical protein
VSRWAAPIDTAAISLSAGVFNVVDGFIDTAESELSVGDIAGLNVMGFAKEAEAALSKASAKAAPVAVKDESGE